MNAFGVNRLKLYVCGSMKSGVNIYLEKSEYSCFVLKTKIVKT